MSFAQTLRKKSVSATIDKIKKICSAIAAQGNVTTVYETIDRSLLLSVKEELEKDGFKIDTSNTSDLSKINIFITW